MVLRSLTMERAIALVEEAFADLAAGDITHQPRRRVSGAGAILHTMSAASTKRKLLIWKNYVTHRQGAQFLVGAHNTQGELLALIEADWLGQLRTGAATAVAARWSLGENAAPGKLALIGAGKQARTQWLAMAQTGLITSCCVYSRSEQRRQDFAAEMTETAPVPITPCGSVEDAVRGAAFVVTATSAKEPFLAHAMLEGARFVAAVGSNWPHRAELQIDVVANAGQVLCDDIQACQAEAGDLLQAAQAGVWSWDRALSLCDLASSNKQRSEDFTTVSNPLASTTGQITPNGDANKGYVLFKSVGLALEDLALAAEMLPR